MVSKNTVCLWFNGDALDADIIRLGKLEAADFRSALQAAAPRQNADIAASV